MNLAAIACSNGLGHIRRMVSISVFMLKNGYNGKIDAFMAKDHLYFLKNWPDCSFFLNDAKVKIFYLVLGLGLSVISKLCLLQKKIMQSTTIIILI